MSVTAPEGFEAAGAACGIKGSGAPDLALVATADRTPVVAAGVFTTNRVQAAPVCVSRQHLEDQRAAAVVINSGNANAATGERGLDDARATCRLVAEALGCEPSDVLVCSTGLIGFPLPMPAIECGVPELAALAGDAEAGTRAAEAMMTTDTRPKEVARSVQLPRTGDAGGEVTAAIGAMGKGAAMLSPSMATMLAVVTTDAAVEAHALAAMLDHAVDASFHQLTVDGSTSTNDTVLALAGGAAGNDPIETATPAYHEMTAALTGVLRDLAWQMARDAEGATVLVRVHVLGARSEAEARRAARHVADSLLVKCSLYGRDPYWGRVLSELGASGAALEPERVSIAYNGVTVCEGGLAAEHDPDALAAAMDADEIEIRCDLGLGAGDAVVLTSDLTHAYVDENMGTS